MLHPAHTTAIILCSAACLLLVAASLLAPSSLAQAANTPSPGCSNGLALPVLLPDGQSATGILQDFDPPAQNWLPGHRGIDIAAPTKSTLLAPADGTLSFVGSVGGKDDLSLTLSPGTVLSFEPVKSSLKVGATVRKGQPLGQVEGHSDHCDGSCLHWGARRQGVYVDPRTTLSPVRIILKPVIEPGGA